MPRAYLLPLAIAGAVLTYSCIGGEVRRFLGLAGRPVIAAAGDNFRVATWNLRNFPRETRDQSRVRANLLSLGADLIAVQEVVDPEVLQQLMPEWELHLSQRGGRGHQRLGVLFNPQTVEVVSPLREHASLELGGRVRPAVSIEVRCRRTGLQLSVVVVHLKARPQGFAKRSEQWPKLGEVVANVTGQAATPHVVVLGDFNLTGPPGGSPQQEQVALAHALQARADLHLVPNLEGCSAYWEGGRRDRWKEPSLLDLIWVGSLEHRVAGGVARSFAHCARHRCQSFRADEAYPDLDYAVASDHCPVVVDLRPGQ